MSIGRKQRFITGQSRWPHGAALEPCCRRSPDSDAKSHLPFFSRCATLISRYIHPCGDIHKRWDVTQESFRLRSDGGNLAAVLLDLRKTDGKRYALIVKQLAGVAGVQGILCWKKRPARCCCAGWANKVTRCLVPHLTSDGSLRLFCLLTLLSLPPERLPDVMFFDRPELGLHPHAITLVAEMFKRLSKKEAANFYRHAIALFGGLLRAGKHHRGQRQQRRNHVAQSAA